MIPSQLQPLANHLWQSTLFAAVAGLLTLALRKNRAQTRYWLWLAASDEVPYSFFPPGRGRWPLGPACRAAHRATSFIVCNSAGEPTILCSNSAGRDNGRFAGFARRLGPSPAVRHLGDWVCCGDLLLVAAMARSSVGATHGFARRSAHRHRSVGLTRVSGTRRVRRLAACAAAAHRCHRSPYAAAVGNHCCTRNVSRPAARQSG